MSGTKAGGIKAAKTTKERHGDGFYARIGAKGGRNGHTGGFNSNPELAKIAGRKGGLVSKRGGAYKKALESNRELIEQMYNDFGSYADIARTVNLPYQAVRWYIKRHLKN